MFTYGINLRDKKVVPRNATFMLYSTRVEKNILNTYICADIFRKA